MLKPFLLSLPRTISVFLFALCVGVGCLLSAPTVFAFGVFPSSMELSGSRGQTVRGSFTIENTSSKPEKYYFRAMKFQPKEGASKEDSGRPEFIPYDVDHTGLPEWVVFEKSSLAVPAKGTVDVPFTITVPEDAKSGSYFAGLLSSLTPSEIVNTDVSVTRADLASLLFFTVSGETIEKVTIVDVSSSLKGASVSVPYGDVSVRLTNSGNVYSVPKLSVSLRDMFGRVLPFSIPSTNDKLLPQSTRTFTGSFGKKPEGFLSALQGEVSWLAIGPVDVIVSVDYAKGKDPLVSSFAVWMMPWRTLLVFFGCVVFLFVAYKLLIRFALNKRHV